MNKYLIISLFLMLLTQGLAFIQCQSQFFWPWGKENPIVLSLMGVVISYLIILSVKYCALAFNGQIWPGRLLGFAVGAMVFTVLSWVIMKEPISLKTFICLILAAGILGIQIIWR